MKFTPKEIRVYNNLSMETMGKKIGMNQNSYYMKESGKRKFTFNDMIKIANVGGVSIDEMTEKKED